MPYPHSFIKLTLEEQKKITDKLRKLAIAGEYRKRKQLQVVWLSDSGLTFEQIARRLGKSYRTIQRWLSKYRKEELNGLGIKDDK